MHAFPHGTPASGLALTGSERPFEMTTLGNQTFLAEIDLLQGRYAEVAAVYPEVLALGHETREWIFENVAHSGLADAYRLTLDFGPATVLYRQVIRNPQIYGNKRRVQRILCVTVFVTIARRPSSRLLTD